MLPFPRVILPFLFFCSALAAQVPVDHVIHISVDGLSGLLLQDRLANDPTGLYSNFKRLVDEGVSTFNARTDYFKTNTLPNHVSMVTGRPVSQPAAQASTVHHGWTENKDPEIFETLHNAGNPNLSYVASTFDVVHDNGLSTAMFAGKSKFVLFEQSYDAGSGAPDLVGADDGTDKIDTYVEQGAIQGPFLAQMAVQHYTYAFLHYRHPDGAGHSSGWGSLQWDDAVQDVDDWLGEVMTLVESDPVLAGRTVIIVGSDHGGIGMGHGNALLPENYTIPLFAWGAGITAGADFYALNTTTRLDPGVSRPTYDDPVQPIRNVDGGNLALSLLGLPPVPGSSINQLQDLATGFAPVITAYGSGINPAGSFTLLSGSGALGSNLVFGVDNPLGTQLPGAIPFMILSRAPAPGFPGGVLSPGLGMGANGVGELLVSLLPGDLFLPVFFGFPWTGAGNPAAVQLGIPNDASIVGQTFYFQGGLVDFNQSPVDVRLADAMAVTVGF